MGTKANLLAGTGVLYTAPVGEALPELDDLAPPAITVTPGGNWAAMGFSIENHRLVTEAEFQDVQVNEHLADIFGPCIREAAMLLIKAAESDMTAWNTALSSRFTLNAQAAGADQTAQDQLGFGDKASLTQRSILYLDTNPEGGSRVIHGYIAQAQENLEILKGLNHEGFDFGLKLYVDPTQAAGERVYKVYDITAVATS